MIDFLAPILLGVILLASGYPLAARLCHPLGLGRGETVLFAFGIGAIFVYLLVLAVGWWRLDATTMGGVLGVLTLAAVSGGRRLVGDGITLRGWRAKPGEALILGLVGSVALLSLVQGLAPPNDYDSLMYHLALPKRDVEAGRLEIAWSHTMFSFFPQLMGNLYRLYLSLMGERGVQVVSGVFGLFAAGGTALLVRRLGGSALAAALAALMLLSLRSVVWEMASCEVDVALAGYSALALLATLILAQTNRWQAAVLLAVALAGAVLVKYQGLAVIVSLVPSLMWMMVRRRVSLSMVLLTAAIVFVLFVPHMARNAVYTGNPLYPLFAGLFNPGAKNFFTDTAAAYGPGQGWDDLLLAPWRIFMAQHAFDGMMIGAPYLLALAPAAVLARPVWRIGIPLIVFTAVFFLLWFYLLSQQIRFLMPVFPVLAAWAGLGVVALWSRTSAVLATRLALICGLLVLAANQAAFVGIYALIRVAPAIGVISAEAYHRDTPTMQGAFYATCTYIAANLAPGQRYLALIWPHSSYCPQKSALVNGTLDQEADWWLRSKQAPPFDPVGYLRELEAVQPRFVIVQSKREDRANETAVAEIVVAAPSQDTPQGLILSLVTDLQPLAQDRFSAVYDGPEVLRVLRARVYREN